MLIWILKGERLVGLAVLRFVTQANTQGRSETMFVNRSGEKNGREKKRFELARPPPRRLGQTSGPRVWTKWVCHADV